LTINKWLKVGKYNALSGNTASGRSEQEEQEEQEQEQGEEEEAAAAVD
jgi:transcription elongation factor Elf1